MKPAQKEATASDVSAGIESRVLRAVAEVQEYLLRIQNDDGHWCGELEGDTILESEYILTMHFIGRLHERRILKAARYLVEKSLQKGDGQIVLVAPLRSALQRR